LAIIPDPLAESVEGSSQGRRDDDDGDGHLQLAAPVSHNEEERSLLKGLAGVR